MNGNFNQSEALAPMEQVYHPILSQELPQVFFHEEEILDIMEALIDTGVDL